MGYSEKDITVIREDVEKIKKRHTMYINGFGWTALMHLLREVLQNSIDEAENKESNCDKIFVKFDENTKCTTIADRGRGVPHGAMEDVCTIIQSSGKFEKSVGNNAYGFAAGTNGVGLTCVNALSTNFRMVSIRDGVEKTCEFEFGYLVNQKEKKSKSKTTGTIVSFIPNEEIINKVKPNVQDILDLCETMSYLCKVKIEVEITLKNKKVIQETYYSKNGILDLLNKLSDGKAITKPVYFKHDDGDKKVEVAFCYAPESEYYIKEGEVDCIRSFVNFCSTPDLGTHVVGFRQGIANALIKYTRENILTKKEQEKMSIIGDDVRSGLIAVINADHMYASFVGQIKNKCNNEDLIPFVRKATYSNILKWSKENEKDAKKIGDFVKSMAKVRIKASEEKKHVIKKDFANIFSKNRPKNWKPSTGKSGLVLYIVEGESAGGSANQSRDKSYQELYYLKGVPKGTLDLTISGVLANDELRGLVTCLGTNIGKDFNIKKLRWIHASNL